MTEEDADFTRNWWRKKVADPDALLTFLEKLYKTEFDGYFDNIAAGQKWARGNEPVYNIFFQTAQDERRHAEMLVPIIRGRDGPKGNLPVDSFYWEEMEKAIVSLETCAAVFHLGEKLAAERFEIMLAMPETPEDIRGFLTRALPDEQHHARIFGKLAGVEAIAIVQAHHDATVARLKSG